MSKPFLTIIMISDNHGRFIDQAIFSIISQEFNDFELLIFNNNSNDNTDECVRKYLDDSRISYFIKKEKQNSNIILIEGFKAAKGSYIAIIDGNNYYLTNALSIFYETAETESNADIICGKLADVDAEGRITQDIKNSDWGPTLLNKNHSPLVNMLLYYNCICKSASIIKKDLLNNYQFDEKYSSSFYLFALDLIQDEKKICFIDQTLVVNQKYNSYNHVAVGSIVQFEENMSIFETYITEQNYNRLHGSTQVILNDLNLKINAYKRKFGNESLSEMAGRIVRLKDKIYLISNDEHKNRVKSSINGPIVSVIVPTYNRPEMLAVAIQSIKDQSCKDFEIVVVNDGGEDVEPVLSRSGIREKIKYIKLPENHERSYARNAGIKAAKGKYIAYLDDDDFFHSHHLQTLLDVLENTGFRAAYTDAYRTVGKFCNGKFTPVSKTLPLSHEFSLRDLLIMNLFPTLCVMHQRALIEEVGLFDESFTTHEDWEYWLRIGSKYPFVHINKVTAEFTVRDDGSNTAAYNFDDFNRTRKIIYERYRSFCGGDQNIINIQKKVLEEYEMESVAHFIHELSQMMNEQMFEDAIKLYVRKRHCFGKKEILGKIDKLIERLSLKLGYNLSPVLEKSE